MLRHGRRSVVAVATAIGRGEDLVLQVGLSRPATTLCSNARVVVVTVILPNATHARLPSTLQRVGYRPPRQNSTIGTKNGAPMSAGAPNCITAFAVQAITLRP